MTLSEKRRGDVLGIQKGNITYIHGDPEFAKITVTGSENQAYVSPKLVTKHNLRVGDLVEFKSKTYDKGPSVTEFTKIRGGKISNASKTSKKKSFVTANQQKSQHSRKSPQKNPKKQSIAKKVGSKIKEKVSRLFTGQDGYMRKMYLFAMGGSDADFGVLESRAESLCPFIEYVNLAKQSNEHLKKRSKFIWEVVENQKRLEITERLGADVRVRRTILPYVVENEEMVAISAETQIMHPKTKQVAKILRLRVTDDGTEFSTDIDLNLDEGWRVLDEELAPFEWSHNRAARLISKVSIGEKNLPIKVQEATGEWFNLVLETDNEITENSQLLFDGQRMDWETVPGSDIFGPLKDGNTERQVISRVRAGDSIVVDGLPTEPYLYDSDGIRHRWLDVTKTTNDVTLKIDLHPDVAAELDEDHEINPLDVLFSPDNEHRELNVVGFNEEGEYVAGGYIDVFTTKGLLPKHKYRIDEDDEKSVIRLNDNERIPLIQVDGRWGLKNSIKMSKIRIKGRDIERQTITVDRVPPNENAILTLSPNAKYLERQREMLLMLRDRPLAHHDSLLKLTEQGNKQQREKLWPKFELEEVENWTVLTGDSNGTEEQHMFVRRALSTPDFAILQGPPGSGKTTAIIELIAQFALQNKRVLLCGSTQASIDNVLTRIISKPNLARLISPMRIGRKDGIYDEGVHHLVLSEQIIQYIELGFSPDEAKDLILRQSNLTCGTMEGVLQHPWISSETTGKGRLLRDPQPEWDVLIVDEASKTTFQQFVVPAGFAKKWILVGDVCQLSPFLESAQLMTNLDKMKDEEGEIFSPASQRSCLIIRQLMEYADPPGHITRGKPKHGTPILMIESKDVPHSFLSEINAQETERLDELRITLIGSHPEQSNWLNCRYLTPNDLTANAEDNLFMLSSDIIICGQDCYMEIAEQFPPHLIVRNGRFAPDEVTKNRSLAFGTENRFSNRHPMSKESLNHDWSHELCWRLNRSYELKVSKHISARERLEQELDELLPKSQNVRRRIEEVRSIALPSVLESLQSGFATGMARELLPESTLTLGFSKSAQDSRFQVISYQHRMDPEISRFSRTEFYDDDALFDADTISERKINHSFMFRNNQSRSTWIDVPSKIQTGSNSREIGAIKSILEDIIKWARENPPTNLHRDDQTRWEVALLSPYQAQRYGLLSMVRTLTGSKNTTRFDLMEMQNPSPIMLLVNTTDRFQGQEADVVFISLRNGGRIGFLNSPNRMNVALTRAREWRVIVGNHSYFSGETGYMDDPMLQSLAVKHRSSLESVKGGN
jgi:hypothetical protein